MKLDTPRTLATVMLVLLCGASCVTPQQKQMEARLSAQRTLDAGRELRRAGRYREAGQLLERSLSTREGALGSKHSELTETLDALATLYMKQGLYAKAQVLNDRSLAIRRKSLGAHHPDIARSLTMLAQSHTKQGNYTKAASLLEEALSIQKQSLGDNHPDVADWLSTRSALSLEQGLYDQAQSLSKKALDIRQESLGQEHPDVAESLSLLAAIRMKQGLITEAEPYIERALSIRRTAFGQEHPDVASSLNDLANVYREQGLYDKALLLYEQALSIREKSLGPASLDVAASLNDLALFYRGQRVHDMARSLFEQALSIREDALASAHPEIVATRNHLARLHEELNLSTKARPLLGGTLDLPSTLGLLDQTKPLLGQAPSLLKDTLGGLETRVASAFRELVRRYQKQGLSEQAWLHLKQALNLLVASVGKDHPDVAASLNDLALLYRSQGRYKDARPLFERALDIRKATLGPFHPEVAATLNDFAILCVAQRDLDQAVRLFTQALTISENRLRQQTLGFFDARLANVLRQLRDEEDRLYSLARVYPDDGRVRRLALSAALLRKGRSLEELAHTSWIISQGLNPADLEKFEQLRVLRTRLSTLAFAGPGRLTPQDHRQRLEELSAQGDALESALAQRSVPLRALHALPAPEDIVDRVAAALPSDGVLLEFIFYDDKSWVPGPAPLHSQAVNTSRYLALMLFADGRTQALDLGPASTVDSAATGLHESLAGRSTNVQYVSQHLHKLTSLRLLPLLGQTRRLFVSSDGQLALVPFAALHDGKRFLVESFEFTYLTSGREVLPPPGDIPPTTSVVVMADPDFSWAPLTPSAKAPDTAGKRSVSIERFLSKPSAELAAQLWPRLPGTRQEAQVIGRLFSHASVLTGREATKEALLKMIRRPRVLHIATHGFFLPDAAAPPGTRAVKVFTDTTRTEHPDDPLLRSGLVLAGAHPRGMASGSPPLGDFLVTALELGGLDLWGTQLVVLSACETGRGDVKRGQGVYGLRRALMAAGAQTVVSSLWKINDETTREFMEIFYKHLRAGMGRVDALHRAMRQLRLKYPHPYYWAPFIAIGRGTPLDLP